MGYAAAWKVVFWDCRVLFGVLWAGYDLGELNLGVGVVGFRVWILRLKRDRLRKCMCMYMYITCVYMQYVFVYICMCKQVYVYEYE